MNTDAPNYSQALECRGTFLREVKISNRESPIKYTIKSTELMVTESITERLSYQNLYHDVDPFPLLKLPPELRTSIYEFACFRGYLSLGFFQTATAVPMPVENYLNARAPGFLLLLICRQVYGEAVPILYDLFMFTFFDNSHIPAVLRELSPRNLKYLHLGWDNREMYNTIEALRKLHGLQTLTLDIPDFGRYHQSRSSFLILLSLSVFEDLCQRLGLEKPLMERSSNSINHGPLGCYARWSNLISQILDRV